MKYLSVCAGIEAASVAWHALGWRAVAFSEIDAFACAVLAHHYPDVPNWGDMTRFQEWPDADVDVLVGGTPCQSFSVAGLRAGIADPRGRLMLVYLAIAARYRPTWVVWENVPGVLSSDKGRAFGALLGGLAELGYGFAYRVLDAQFFGVAQRRRRVFVVGHLGDWRRAAAVLFDAASLRGDSAPRREAGKGVARPLASCSAGGSGYRNDVDTAENLISAPHAAISPAIKARDSKGVSSDGDGDGAILVPMVAHALRASGFDASEDGTGRGTPLVPVAFDTTQITHRANRSSPPPGDPCHPLAAGAHPPAIAFDCKASGQNGFGVGEIASTQRAMGHANSHTNGGGHQAVAYGMQVRRLTPRECERLQGFPDDDTLVPYGKPSKAKLDADFLKYQLRGNPKHLTRSDIDRLAADGPRYKALGNSMAVPVVRWIGRRIDLVERIGLAVRGAA